MEKGHTGEMDWLLSNALTAMRNMERIYRAAYTTHTAEDCSKTKAEKCGKDSGKRL